MSFAGLLGAGLLGGAGSAAKGAGDRIRAEAQQKREIALQDYADEKAREREKINQENRFAIQKQKNSDAVARQLADQKFTSSENALNRTQQMDVQNDSQSHSSGENALNRTQQMDVQNDSQSHSSGENALNRTQQMDVQNDSQSHSSGENALSRTHQTDLQTQRDAAAMERTTATGSNGDGSKPDFTPKDAQAYFTKQAWVHSGVKTDEYGDPLGASEEDSEMVATWVADAMAEWREGGQKQDPSALVQSVFYRPYDPAKAVPNADDIALANERYEEEASWRQSDKSQFGGSERSIRAQWARENAVNREQQTIVSAQNAINKGADFEEVARVLRDQGLDPRLVRPKSK